LFLEIIKNTPIWVFILFIGLVFLGYSQSKDRVVTIKKVFILPFAMIILSIFGVISAFGITKISLILWFFGIITSVLLCLKLLSNKNIKYDNEIKSYFIPGSWMPMVLILFIFFTKYFVGVVIAKQLPIIDNILFIYTISLLYGFLSGVFLSRSILIIKSK